MKILFVGHTFPYPLHEGIRLHVYHLLKNLAREHEIHFICFVESEEEHRYLPKIQPFCHSVTTVVHKVSKNPLRRLINIFFQRWPNSLHQFCSREMERQLHGLAAQVAPDVVHIDFTVMAPYASLFPDIPKVFFPHDAMSMLFERNIPYERNPLFRLYMKTQAAKMRRYEQSVLPIFEEVVTVSPVDRDYLKALAPDARITSNPNGVDTDYFRPRDTPEKENVLLFRGIMNFLPNHDAAWFFIRDVMPLLWARQPRVEFWIAGADPLPELRAAAKKDPRIRLLGFVGDLRRPMAEATVVACPMRIGSGIKNKILESMAMEKAVLATPMSLAGVTGKPNEDFYVAESAAALAEGALRLLQDAALRHSLGRHARQTVERSHSWTAHAAAFTRLYTGAVRRPPSLNPTS